MPRSFHSIHIFKNQNIRKFPKNTSPNLQIRKSTSLFEQLPVRNCTWDAMKTKMASHIK